jgi:mRNA-degrading endonuclease RelE of RelBE toxin-antitoxin system
MLKQVRNNADTTTRMIKKIRNNAVTTTRMTQKIRNNADIPTRMLKKIRNNADTTTRIKVETFRIINNIDKVNSNTIFPKNEKTTRGHNMQSTRNIVELILENTVSRKE